MTTASLSPQSSPYKTQPDRAFWSRSVSKRFDPATVVDDGAALIRHGDKVVSAGSCFASNLAPFIERAGLHYLRTEAMHPAFAAALRDQRRLEMQAGTAQTHTGRLGQAARRALASVRRTARHPQADQEPSLDNFGYAKFSAAYGNIYTVRQLLQLLRRATGSFRPTEDRWIESDVVVDPFRPGLRYKSRTVVEFEALTRQHLECTRDAFLAADVFVLTLGLTEAWVSREDGAVFPACPGTIAGSFDPARHQFVNFSAAEVSADLGRFVEELRAFNPRCRFILTVSPVPLVATATSRHVLAATTYSKAVLRVAAQEVASAYTDVVYFPAYEIVTGPQAPKSFFAADRREVTPEAVATVMRALLARCEGAVASAGPSATAVVDRQVAAQAASAALIEAECEEMMSSR